MPPDLNVAAVASRFKEIKRALEGTMQTDIANSGTSYADTEPDRHIAGFGELQQVWNLESQETGRPAERRFKHASDGGGTHHPHQNSVDFRKCDR